MALAFAVCRPSIPRILLKAPQGNFCKLIYFKRTLNSELNSALRPFYFVVHPDLFGQHPTQRKTNEESLKILREHLDSLYEGKYKSITNNKLLKFYLRNKGEESRDKFHVVMIELEKRKESPRDFIESLLKACNLSTDFIKNVKATDGTSKQKVKDGVHFYRPGGNYEFGKEFNDFETIFRQEKEQKKVALNDWMYENAAIAIDRAKDTADLIVEVNKLKQTLINKLGLSEVAYECGWNIEHYRGCLKSLERLANMYMDNLHPLRNRIVVFAPFTGISLEGHVMLFTGDVLRNWLDFIKNIPQHDAYLKIVPLCEKTLSQVLLNIQIGRRKFMPKQQAKEYASHLMKVTTSLNDYLCTQKYPESWPSSLAEYKIVVESEAGPLMVSPTGQFIAPATCPGWMLVDFLSVNLEFAKERMTKYLEEREIERQLTRVCITYLKIHALTKDDSVTPDKMIITLLSLLKIDPTPFHNVSLHITNFYSVLTDGIVCIPWDFMNR